MGGIVATHYPSGSRKMWTWGAGYGPSMDGLPIPNPMSPVGRLGSMNVREAGIM